MKVIKRGIFSVLTILFLFTAMSALVVSGTDVKTFDATVGGIRLTPKEFIEKTGFPISEEQAQNALEFASRLMSRHKYTLEQTSGVLSVAYRESRFDVTAVNPSGGVAGFFQWSGWSNTINGDRWGMASKRELTLSVQLELMTKELETTHKKTSEKMLEAKTPFEAAKVWSYWYEGVELSDGQSALGDIEKWSETIYQALKTGQTQYFEGVNSSASSLAIPDGWSIDNPYNNKDYNHSGSYPAGQCTWYVYNRGRQLGIVFDDYMGDGGNWFHKAGYKTSQTPKKHTAVSFPTTMPGYEPYGHVAFVEEIRSDGSILISEMNMSGVPYLTMSYRVLDAQSASQLWYVEGK
ncbi:phage tail tip lysozyme [Streptococcus entericus]|uniref:phage tail tip lysozyme n=1 Tax=Streptococcus entericus TaxID=155680 RepID=UPI00036176BF|nr:phage tail tip lysozyme [Streptococcus entericus]